MEANQAGAGAPVGQRKSLEAVKVKACTTCSAPGVYRAPKNIAEQIHYGRWPAIIVKAGDPRDGQPVGDICPCCGANRKGLLQNLGEIWHRYF